jgi:hypothetical protein
LCVEGGPPISHQKLAVATPSKVAEITAYDSASNVTPEEFAYNFALA